MAGIWMKLRIWLGVQWFRAGWGSITGGFDAGGDDLNGARSQKQAEKRRHGLFRAWYGDTPNNSCIAKRKTVSSFLACIRWVVCWNRANPWGIDNSSTNRRWLYELELPSGRNSQQKPNISTDCGSFSCLLGTAEPTSEQTFPESQQRKIAIANRRNNKKTVVTRR